MKIISLIKQSLSVIPLIFFLSFLYLSGLLQPLENKFYDLHFLIRGNIKPSDEIIIISIDEESLQKLGRWPWERKVIAKCIKNIADLEPKVLCVDILFVEESADKFQDLELARAFKRINNSVNSIYFAEMKETIANVVKGKTRLIEISKFQPVFPINVIKENSKAIGFVNAIPDEDGCLRRAMLIFDHNGERYYSINLLSAALFSGCKPEDLIKTKEIYVNYRGGNKSYKIYPMHLIHSKAIPKEWVKDKVVLIGSIATGAFDHYPMPFESVFSGVEFHANVIDNLLKKDYIKMTSPIVNILSILFFSVIIGAICSSLSIPLAMVSSVSILFTYAVTSFLLFSKATLYINPLLSVFAIIFTAVSTSIYKVFSIEREKVLIKRMFSLYVSPTIIKELMSNPEKLKLGGERKELTVLFADIKGFTGLSEIFKPEELTELLNHFMTEMSNIIFKYNGTLDKYIGDAIMAFWGAPITQPEHAYLAVSCAIEMIKKADTISQKYKEVNKPSFEIGIGINTGDMIAGNIGSSRRFSYTVCGNNVNLAWRLQELTRIYNLPIIISEWTYDKVKDKIAVRYVDETTVKGIGKKIKIFSPVLYP